MKQHTVLIVDDEPLARSKLQRLVAGHDHLIEVGTASTGTEALEKIDGLNPEIIFLDIRMPGASGIEVVEKMIHRPHIVFTTAYDEFAVTAFELQAVDYLLKPFGKSRFTKAVERVLRYAAADSDRLSASLQNSTLDRLYVRERGRVKAIDVKDISKINGAGDYAEIVAPSGKHLVNVRMKSLAERLDNAQFIRIHRSTIVNIDQVAEIEAVGNGRYEVTLRDGSSCTASRSGATNLRKIIKNK